MSLDHSVATYIDHHRSAALTHVAWFVTGFGNEVTIALVTVALIAVTYWRGWHRDALMVFVGMGGSVSLIFGLKHLVQRSRPGAQFRLPTAAADHSYSFPSGHTLDATVFVILLVAVLLPRVSRPGAQIAAVLGAALVALGVGASRLYLGYHWATDVIGALVIGSAWGLSVIWWSRTWTVSNEAAAEPVPARR
ncbi:phosphatase PAP2 family protein [Nocardioides marmorisolisilvae]|uniref:Phosphatase PAP2 family protein n=1 Tax=Nocardioides marmorisolisilvae TaxID=1542737 RepID=A0A3N0DTV7_9ACTN|nr:phosphatase PAP2 family protein [Nocardioides marmorisolisilvae]RNL78936.1 phosphatase PAP2 family protein [Nocardioides marmorisolisilvae]